MVAGFRIRSWLIAAALCCTLVPADAQTVCRDTPEGRVCTVQQAIVAGTLVNRWRRRRSWARHGRRPMQRHAGQPVLGVTADHCVTMDGGLNGTAAPLQNLAISAAWSDRTVIPHLVRLGRHRPRFALVFLGAGDFGSARIQLTSSAKCRRRWVVKDRPGHFQPTRAAGPPRDAGRERGLYRSASPFTPSAASATAYTLPMNGRRPERPTPATAAARTTSRAQQRAPRDRRRPVDLQFATGTCLEADSAG